MITLLHDPPLNNFPGIALHLQRIFHKLNGFLLKGSLPSSVYKDFFFCSVMARFKMEEFVRFNSSLFY